MSDITLCSSEGCKRAKKCYRKMAEINPYWQSYSDFLPKTGVKCEYFMEIKTNFNKNDGDSNV